MTQISNYDVEKKFKTDFWIVSYSNFLRFQTKMSNWARNWSGGSLAEMIGLIFLIKESLFKNILSDPRKIIFIVLSSTAFQDMIFLKQNLEFSKNQK